MPSRLRQLVLSLAALFAALALGSNAAPAAERGIGGTGIDWGDLESGGIGGTGFQSTPPAYQDDRGMGGTGIIGTITGFGSIFVNGLEVFTDADLQVHTIDGPLPVDALGLGQVVAVEAFEQDGRLQASSAEVRYPVTGRITAVDAPAGRFKVLGQWVETSSETRLFDRTDSQPGLRPGDYVRVSGLRRPNGIVDASRIDRQRGGPSSVSGTITAADSAGFNLGGLHVPWPARQAGIAFAPGEEVVVVGLPSAVGLLPQRITPRPRVPFGGRLQRLSIEGFAKPGRGGRGLTIDGLAFQSGDLPPGQSLRNRRVIVDGDLEQGGRLRAIKTKVEKRRDAAPLWQLRDEARPQKRLNQQRNQERNEQQQDRQGQKSQGNLQNRDDEPGQSLEQTRGKAEGRSKSKRNKNKRKKDWKTGRGKGQTDDDESDQDLSVPWPLDDPRFRERLRWWLRGE